MSNALINKARTQIKLFEIKLEEYQADHGEFPLGDGSPTSSGSLYDAFYQNGIRSGSKVYMPELDSKYSDSFRGQIRGGLILDPFKHGRPYFYLRAYDASGTMVKGAENPNFDLWSVGPDGVGRGDRGATAAELADDITNW
ncbi:hypothetical protein GCM10007100_05000 [Roseibacillus persicicus]|uniref:Type II secretion system protein GspG C-terminal domain-containing protein n=2 Tax=Roseibacillus persicicus TaxID=454148 RepID=A0A918TET3_9BACT|nr:hypothetical protein GCM10007100_05000 [Roseibacillus persicicus]